MRKKIIFKHYESDVKLETYIEYDDDKFKDLIQRKGIVYVSPEFMRNDSFWNLILSFAVVQNVEYQMQYPRFKFYLLSSQLPSVPEGEQIPEYELIVEDVKEA